MNSDANFAPPWSRRERISLPFYEMLPELRTMLTAAIGSKLWTFFFPFPMHLRNGCFSMVAAATELRMLQKGELYDPHGFLGIHPTSRGRKVIRLWRPGAQKAHVELFGKPVEAYRVDGPGLFELVVPALATSADYRVYP